MKQLIVPYNPEHNGVVKRKKRAIVGVAKAIIQYQSLSFFLWVKACSTPVYIQNRSPHHALG